MQPDHSPPLPAEVPGDTHTTAAAQPVPWLSILVPVYNVAPYLPACLDSIQRQVVAGVEILLVDDGSTDDSRRICEALCAQRAATVRLLLHECNRGLSAARNTLLEAARGYYVWFVDSDDTMLPGAIATLQSVATRHQPDLILCAYRERGRTLNGFTGPAGVLSRDRDALLRGVFASRRMYSWSRVARRELWGRDLRFPEGRCFEDIMTTPWLCLRARSFYYVDRPWIEYRLRDDSIMAAATGRVFDQGMNDDLAGALDGFHAHAASALPEMSTATRRSITEFSVRIFTDIAWRLLWTHRSQAGWSTTLRQLRRYRAMTERDSLVSFASVAARPLRRFKLKLALKTWLLLLLTGQPRAAD